MVASKFTLSLRDLKNNQRLMFMTNFKSKEVVSTQKYMEAYWHTMSVLNNDYKRMMSFFVICSFVYHLSHKYLDVILLPWCNIFYLDIFFLPWFNFFYFDIILLPWCDIFYLDIFLLLLIATVRALAADHHQATWWRSAEGGYGIAINNKVIIMRHMSW